jgi:hypothetical protein
MTLVPGRWAPTSHMLDYPKVSLANSFRVTEVSQLHAVMTSVEAIRDRRLCAMLLDERSLSVTRQLLHVVRSGSSR